MVKTLSFFSTGSVPGWGTKIPRAAGHGPKILSSISFMVPGKAGGSGIISSYQRHRMDGLFKVTY